jgi:hypothetical protein
MSQEAQFIQRVRCVLAMCYKYDALASPPEAASGTATSGPIGVAPSFDRAPVLGMVTYVASDTITLLATALYVHI